MLIVWLLWLYLIEILHQTTTPRPAELPPFGCILLKFYIKPQLFPVVYDPRKVVSYWNSTSNHNVGALYYFVCYVVSYWNSTSNHNTQVLRHKRPSVVSYWNSTSNHNLEDVDCSVALVVSYWNSTSNHNAGVAICSISVRYTDLPDRKIECENAVEVSLMCYFLFQRTKILFF